MADQKITELTEDTAPTSDDLVVVVNDPAGTPGSKKVTLANLIKGLGGVWTPYTPSLTNITLGNGTLDFAYLKIGKLIIVRGKFVFGSSSAVGGPAIFSLPVTGIAAMNTFYETLAQIEDNGTTEYMANVTQETTTTISVGPIGTSSTYAQRINTSSTVPMTWATNDAIRLMFMYEAA